MSVSAPRRSYQAADVGRALAISLVITGHTLMPWIVGPFPFSEPAFHGWQWGAAFLIPFFFFISGCTWRAEKSLKSTFRECLMLVLLALSVSVLWDGVQLILVQLGLGQQLDLAPITPLQFFKNSARSALFGYMYQATVVWFLTALATSRLATALILRAPRLLHIPIIALLIVLGLAAHSLELRNIYHLQSVGVGAACLYIGYRLRNAPAYLESRPLIPLLLGVLGGVALFASYDLNKGCMLSLTETCGNAWYDGRFAVLVSHGNFGNPFWFTVTCVAGIAFGLSVSVLVARYGSFVAQRLAIIGRNALGLFTVHALWFPILIAVTALAAPPQASNTILACIAFGGVFVNLILYAITPLTWLRRCVQNASKWLVGFRRPNVARSTAAL